MLKINWYLVYFAAACLDIIHTLVEWGTAGTLALVINRLITIFAVMSFALYFEITGVTGWMFPLLGVGGALEVPLLGDVLEGLPIDWLVMVWRIHRKNRKVGKLEALAEKAAGEYNNERGDEAPTENQSEASESQYTPEPKEPKQEEV
ncbi:MAG: hypothetical protein HY226_06465 [Candidatus Vogelbacteria bacterium]|nr:hypothetical protein [Candidatus Vogelbacteria bacterium]